VHDALRLQLDPVLVRLFAGLAEHPHPLAPAKDKQIEQERRDFFALAWKRCESFLYVAQAAYGARLGPEDQPAGAVQTGDPARMAPIFEERLRAAMRIPAIEPLFAAPWTVAARRVLPSASPQFTATSMWGPVLGWCALQLLAELIDADRPELVALDLFDRLRLREPFAQAFAALGFEGEEAWRVAARIKVVLLTGSGAGKPEDSATEAAPAPDPEAAPLETNEVVSAAPATAAGVDSAMPEQAEAAPAWDEKVALSPSLWHDPDVRWLTGVHEADGHSYLVREQYEELLWWLLMPSLLRLAGEAAPSRAAVEEMSKTVNEALKTAEAAAYRIDTLLGSSAVETPEPEEELIEPETPEPEQPELLKPDSAAPAAQGKPA
jgi:hypothetical protein